MDGEWRDPAEEEEEFHSTTGNLMDTRTSHLDDTLFEKLEEAFDQPTFKTLLHDVGKVACEYSPIDLAHIASRFPSNYRAIIYENLPDFESKVAFTIHTDSVTRRTILRYLENKEIKSLVEEMPLDEAVWVLDDLPERKMRNILEQLDAKKARTIRELRQHDRNSAARLMSNEFFAFTMDTKIGEAAEQIRENPDIDLSRRIFVINEIGELQGYVPARNMIVNPPDLPLRKVMQPVLHKASLEASREEVIDLAERYRISALPVVDENDVLEGIITYEDVIEAMEEATDETLALFAGTHEKVGIFDPVRHRFFSRVPWLLVTLCAGMVNMANMSYFEELEGAWFVIVFFFVPLITGMSGNVGLQCSTVLVRSMSTGGLTGGGRGEVARKEIMTGAWIGSAFGLASMLLIVLINALGIHKLDVDPYSIGIIVACGLMGACLTATGLGVASPLFFAKIGVDPAVSSGPIVTAFNDVLSTIMYFVIARFLSHVLVIT